MTEAPERIWAYEYCNQIFAARSPTWFPFWADARAYVPDRADLPAAVTVKPLVWEKIDAPTAWWRADGLGGEYNITWNWNSTGHVLTHPGKNGMERNYFDSADEAKAAAQTDHERRILSCLTTQPDPVKDAAREKSLAECLSDLCLMARRSRDLINTKVSDLDVITFTATKGQLKAALRALAEQEQGDE